MFTPKLSALALAGLLASASFATQALVIDNFESPASLQAVSTFGSLPASNQGGPYPGTNVIGSYRDLYVHNKVGTGDNQESYIDAGASNGGFLEILNDPNIRATAEVTWDGNRNGTDSATTVDPIGLYTGAPSAGKNLLADGATGFYLGFLAGDLDASQTITLNVWTNAANFATLSLTEADTQTGPTEDYLFFRFTSFSVTGTLDWTNIGAIQLVATASSPGANSSFTTLETRNLSRGAPEPASLALTSLGLLGLGWSRRRAAR